jgi:hypothetical protein
MEITIIGFTSDLTLDYFLSIFVYTTSVIVPFFGALSLIATKN